MELAIYIIAFILVVGFGMIFYWMYLVNKTLFSYEKTTKEILLENSKTTASLFYNLEKSFNYNMNSSNTAILNSLKDKYLGIKANIDIMSENLVLNNVGILNELKNLSIKSDNISYKMLEENWLERLKRIIEMNQVVNEKIIAIQKQLGIIK